MCLCNCVVSFDLSLIHFDDSECAVSFDLSLIHCDDCECAVT